jgi:chromosome segregation ATPase
MHRTQTGQLPPQLLSSFAACLPAPQANKASAASLAEAQAAKQQVATELASAQQELAGQAAALEQLQGQKAKLETSLKSAAAQAAAQLAEQAQGSSKALAGKAAAVAELQAQTHQLAADLKKASGEAQKSRARVAVLEADLTAAQARVEQRGADAVAAANWEAERFALQASVGQLREAAEVEAAARKAVERERTAAQGEVERLSVKIADLNGEVESLRDSVSHLGESLTNALAEGAGGSAEDDKSESGGREVVGG